MKTLPPPNRRDFLALVAGSAGVVAAPAAALKTPTSFPVAGVQVRGLAVSPTGVIAVAADRHVDFYRADGRCEERRELDSPVRAVAFDSRGRLYAALKDSIAFSDSCCFESLPLRLGREAVFTSLAIDDVGDIYVADSGNRQVWRISAEGTLKGRVPAGKGGFKVAKAFFPIAWRDGQLFIAEPGRHRVLAFNAAGELVREWGSRSRTVDGFGGCCNPVGLAAAADGFVTAERGRVRVKRFDVRDGKASLLAGPDQFAKNVDAEAGACDHGGVDVAVAGDGKVLVLDRAARRIEVLT